MRYLVTRHLGAVEWCRQQGIDYDYVVDHLDIMTIQPEDEVIGILPIPLVAYLLEKGAKYFHLTLPLTSELRGKELTAKVMTQLKCSLKQYHITELN
jgi:CRISPR-associated protein Csx16